MPKIFKVGGCVRDGLLGVKTKDIDFTFVLDDLNKTVEEGFKEMEQWMIDEGFTIFLSVPEMFTIRAKFPTDHKFAKLDADFVMARKEVGYVEGTRRPILELGTLEDDLLRRDFTLNAMAEDIDGNLIDIFGGIDDLKIGLFLPKSHIPIVKETVEDIPDYYLLLSHNFTDEIIKKNKPLIEKGVKFIIPFPEIQII
jgi:tRNA nucleotidyltransferase/poly(A) polymerase